MLCLKTIRILQTYQCIYLMDTQKSHVPLQQGVPGNAVLWLEREAPTLLLPVPRLQQTTLGREHKEAV